MFSVAKEALFRIKINTLRANETVSNLFLKSVN